MHGALPVEPSAPVDPGASGPAPDVDSDLLARAAAGDRGAFAELVTRHQATVHRFAAALTRDAAAAEDVLQETFLAALKAAGSFRGEGSVRGWLLTIARNAALRYIRPREMAEGDHDTLEQLGRAAGWGEAPGPDGALDAARMRAAVWRAIEALSEEDREILVLRDIEGLSGEDTCAALGLGLAAMKSRLHRARLRFAAALGREDHHG